MRTRKMAAKDLEAKVDDIVQRVTAIANRGDSGKSIYDGNEIPVFTGNIQGYQNAVVHAVVRNSSKCQPLG